MLRGVHSRSMWKMVVGKLPEGSYGRNLAYKQSKTQPLQNTPRQTQVQTFIYLLYFTLFYFPCTCIFTLFMPIQFQPFQSFSPSLIPIPFIKLSTWIGHGSLRKMLIVIGQKFNTSYANFIISIFYLRFWLHLCLILAKCFL